MIKNTFETTCRDYAPACKDNAAVMEGSAVGALLRRPQYRPLRFSSGARAHFLMKVETHNHPTAISPWPGRRPHRVPRRIRDGYATGVVRNQSRAGGLLRFRNLRVFRLLEQMWKRILASRNVLSPR